jgi:hypothetical protein
MMWAASDRGCRQARTATEDTEKDALVVEIKSVINLLKDGIKRISL